MGKGYIWELHSTLQCTHKYTQSPDVPYMYAEALLDKY